MGDDHRASGGQEQERFLLTVPALDYLRHHKPMGEVPQGEAVRLGLEDAARGAFPLHRFSMGTSYYVASITAQVAEQYSAVSDKLVMAVKLDDLLLSSVGSIQLEAGLAERRLKELGSKGIITITQGYVPVSDIDTVLRDYIAAAFGEEMEYEGKVVEIGERAKEREEQDGTGARRSYQVKLDMIAECFAKRKAYFVNVARKIVKGHEAAEDVVQDAFIKAMKGADKYEGKSALSSWIYRITINAAIDYQRQDRWHVDIDDVDYSHHNKSPTDVPFPSSEDMILDSEKQEKLQLAIHHTKMNSRMRQTLELRFNDGLPYKEIAVCTNTLIGTVMSRLHHAKKKLRRRLRAIVYD